MDISLPQATRAVPNKGVNSLEHLPGTTRTRAAGTNDGLRPGTLATKCRHAIEKGTISDAIGHNFSIRLGRAAQRRGPGPPSLPFLRVAPWIRFADQPSRSPA
ncbi:hypothetical protein VUR80DRAFT_9923 [Thermomyces stellatus]